MDSSSRRIADPSVSRHPTERGRAEACAGVQYACRSLHRHPPMCGRVTVPDPRCPRAKRHRLASSSCSELKRARRPVLRCCTRPAQIPGGPRVSRLSCTTKAFQAGNDGSTSRSAPAADFLPLGVFWCRTSTTWQPAAAEVWKMPGNFQETSERGASAAIFLEVSRLFPDFDLPAGTVPFVRRISMYGRPPPRSTRAHWLLGLVTLLVTGCATGLGPRALRGERPTTTSRSCARRMPRCC
mgnify:CR=1 FL=1